MRPLRKTIIVIWSEPDEQHDGIGDLAREAECGGAYCSRQESSIVQEPPTDSDWDGTEFFDDGSP